MSDKDITPATASTANQSFAKWGGPSGLGDRRQAYDDLPNYHVMYTGHRSVLLAYESGMRNNCWHYNQGSRG